MKQIILSYGRPQMPDNVDRVLAEAQETAAERENSVGEEGTEQPATPSFITYKELEWEVQAPRKAGSIFKERYTYDQHEKRLKEEGWERAPTPQEISTLLIDDLEGKLNKSQQALASDIQSSYWEWFCHAAQRQENTLHIYEYVTQLPEDTTKEIDVTVIPSWCKSHRSFDITRLTRGVWNDIKYIDPDLVTYFYSRPFEAFPQVMQTGATKAQIYISERTDIIPLTRNNFFGVGCYPYYNTPSRGVRKAGGTL